MISSVARRVVSKVQAYNPALQANLRHRRSGQPPSKLHSRGIAKKVETPKYAAATGEGKKRSPAFKHGSTATASEPRGESLSSTIKQLNSVSDYAKAMEVWNQAKERGVEVNEFAFATILSTFRHLSDYEGALKVYDEVKAKGIRNAFIDSQILDVYARMGEIQLALDLFYDMTTNGLDVKLYAFNSLMKALITTGRVGEALGMVTQHGSHFAEIDKSFWPSLVSSVISTHDHDACRDLLKQILHAEVQLPQSSYLSFLHLFSDPKVTSNPTSNKQPNQEGDTENPVLTELIDALRSQGATGLATLIVFHTERNDAKGALEVWDQLKSQPKFFSSNAFTHLITVCAASGHLEEVEDIYKTMLASGYEASPPVLAAMIRLYASNLQADNAQSLFDTLLSQPSYVSPFLFNTMLDLYSDIGDQASALRIVDKMKEKRMKFNVSIYNSLINLHLRTNNPEKAVEVYHQMKADKLPLNFLSYKPLLGSTLPTLSHDSLLKEINSSTTISDLGKSILAQIAVPQKGKPKKSAAS
jgi:pentatricopeptide repeat protein